MALPSSQTLGLTLFTLLNHRTISDSVASLSEDKNAERLNFLETHDHHTENITIG